MTIDSIRRKSKVAVLVVGLRHIHAESERLSRLIDNVLQLARMTRRELALNVEPVTAGTGIGLALVRQLPSAMSALFLMKPANLAYVTGNGSKRWSSAMRTW